MAFSLKKRANKPAPATPRPVAPAAKKTAAQKPAARPASGSAPELEGIAVLVYNRLRGWIALRGLRASILLNIVLGIAVTALSVSLAMLANRPPAQPVYFATNPNGTVAKLIPLNRPIGTKTTVLNWAGRVATTCFTWGFDNIEHRVSSCEQKYFTTKGAGEYRGGLVAAHEFRDTEHLQTIQETSLDGAPVIVQTGHYGKRYAYEVKVPVNVRVFGATVKTSTTQHDMYLLIVRAPTVEMPSGLAVANFKESE